MPPRLPFLTSVLRPFNTREAAFAVRIFALSYRGYWKSTGRPSEAGIRVDAATMLRRVREQSHSHAKTVLWGQSLGAAVAADLAASDGGIDGLVMETPFLSIKEMLISLYPQKWLPYRYLWPFLRSWWDNKLALERLAGQAKSPKMLIMTAQNDEVVPPKHGRELLALAEILDLDVRAVTAPKALHHEAMNRKEGSIAMTEFLKNIADH